MEKHDKDLHLLDFGAGILAGLHLHGVQLLSDYDEPRLHGAFVTAFQHVEATLEKENLRFWMTTDRFHGVSPDVHTIMNHWLGTWATKDAPGNTWRLSMSNSTAVSLIDEELAGGREIWLTAAGMLIEKAGLIARPRSFR